MLFAQMCFVGSLLTSKLSSSLMLLGMFVFWNSCALFIMERENSLERIERTHERAKFEIIVHLLEQGRKKK